MPTYNFEELKIYGRKSGNCQVCGKQATRSAKFSQTLNPFNKKDGRVKTRDEIIEELRYKLSTWKDIPVVHSKCEQ